MGGHASERDCVGWRWAMSSTLAGNLTVPRARSRTLSSWRNARRAGARDGAGIRSNTSRVGVSADDPHHASVGIAWLALTRLLTGESRQNPWTSADTRGHVSAPGAVIRPESCGRPSMQRRTGANLGKLSVCRLRVGLPRSGASTVRCPADPGWAVALGKICRPGPRACGDSRNEVKNMDVSTSQSVPARGVLPSASCVAGSEPLDRPGSLTDRRQLTRFSGRLSRIWSCRDLRVRYQRFDARVLLDACCTRS